MNKLEELEKKYKELGEEIERLKSKSTEKRWRADFAEDYFYIDDVGNILCDDDEDIGPDIFRYNNRNYFRTQAEAEKALNKIIIYNQLKDLAERLNDGETINWNDSNQRKWRICFDTSAKKLDYEYNLTYKCLAEIYCLDPDFLDRALDEIGEEDLMKLFEE